MTINGIEFSASLNEILDELVIQLRANGIQLIQKMVPTSTHIQICCPYHSNGLERRPSAGIRKSDGLFHCFACNEVHSLAEVISHCFGKDSTGFFGWNWLLKNFASVEVEDRKPIKLDYTRQKNVSQQATFVTEEELDKYRYYHPYWTKRGITNEHIIELFDLGYDDKTSCITMPVRNIEGQCVFVARRSVNYKYFNYPKGVEKPVYGLYELSNECGAKINEVIICESMIDALTCWEYGKYAVALNGLGTPKQFQELNNFPCRKYILATDVDERGLDARRRLKQALKNKIVTEYRWDLSIAKDINDMSKEYFDSLVEFF